ncbi:hypothetical protein [Nocardioides zhouii]|uniref:Uncharacterized protein n=1 Tax=Nocardioides zhouii TaxID=1168729 RepID=A0A4Q2T4N9_9ACTN|nr:hypothetical protein [Nocardioides zhouii]RYC13746.1 hypothetical protein EUA94_03850 [Nocardioides zhouii]
MTAVQAGQGNRGHRAVSRIVTLVLAVGFAVVGIAGAASAHHNTITGTTTCKDGGGWTVSWTVVNSETIAETITASNRTSVVPVGTGLTGSQTRTFTETVTTKPTAALNLTLTGKWVRDGNNIYSTNSDAVEVSEFSDACIITTVKAPTVPVIDDCGPGNARFGTVPSGPWTSKTNPDGSLTITANQGYRFTNGQTTVTYAKPTDSNTPCPVTVPTVPVIDDCGPGNARYGTVPTGQWTSKTNPDGSLTITANPGFAFPNGQQSVTLPVPTDSNVACPTPPTTPPVVTPPVVTPPVVALPEVLPAELLVVKAGARWIDKCGRESDLFKVARNAGVVYKVNGKVIRQGVWLKARTRSVTVRASAADATYQLQGKSVWKLSFTRKACAQAPQVAPHTGS